MASFPLKPVPTLPNGEVVSLRSSQLSLQKFLVTEKSLENVDLQKAFLDKSLIGKTSMISIMGLLGVTRAMLVEGDRNGLFSICITTALERISGYMDLVAYNSRELRDGNCVPGVALELLSNQGVYKVPAVTSMESILGFRPNTLIVSGVSLPMADAMSRSDVQDMYDCFHPSVVAVDYTGATVRFDITI